MSRNSDISVVLEDQELWRQFHELGNEMIVTKAGRRMFPVLRIRLNGLEDVGMYSILLDFLPVGDNKWKYINGEWLSGGNATSTSTRTYTHPDSPNYGKFWTKEVVSFNKVKLTNQGQGQVVLASLHKYQPRVRVLFHTSGSDVTCLTTQVFEETQFIAVTAYQNEEVTALKIRHNPFAKAFQDCRSDPPDSHDIPITLSPFLPQVPTTVPSWLFAAPPPPPPPLSLLPTWSGGPHPVFSPWMWPPTRYDWNGGGF